MCPRTTLECVLLGIIDYATRVTVSFQFLVYSFGLPISLGVIGSGKGDVVLKEAGKLLDKG